MAPIRNRRSGGNFELATPLLGVPAPDVIDDQVLVLLQQSRIV